MSGIAPLSPAFSISERSGSLLFSAFTAGNYGIYAIENRAALAGAEPNGGLAALTPGVLPPRERSAATVARLLEQPAVGLPPSSGFQRADYKPSLALEYIAPPEVGGGTGTFGSFVGGGTAFY